ncbi:hypothetical protein A8L34_26185 [Bacillus sp. FJAT-27264]|uniref:WYL domain-containing protein n=1 Tax=Paenibacillus sp. (strain DSM 101736 / FJAT-27264) TaxID=1850362 RepID=UPI000808058F|nr:WYL domain-containing protein [Bacillus sp. FJAT-27264]OBZ07620.1 hypothetical protein A8L34_26185 [Bacillus sp. FJAT-27264]
MNLFEKIFNYQIISRLDDNGTFMVTAHERAWLKTMLEHPAAADAFTAETLEKLVSLLESDPLMDTANHLVQKARSREKQVYHPLLRTLRRHIMAKEAVQLTYGTKRGSVQEGHTGVPYKLEYSMVKREWYLLWYHLNRRSLMSTKLSKIVSVSHQAIATSKYESILHEISLRRDTRKFEVVIEIVPDYNRELSRILYAFSSFEKDVAYDADKDTYSVSIILTGNDSDYLLSKLRFLGKRVRVVKGNYLKKRMQESAIKALKLYGVLTSEEELSS